MIVKFLMFKMFGKSEPNIYRVNDLLQVGIGLLVLQQLSGINGILFYSSNIFKAAGKLSMCMIFQFSR